MGWLNFEGEDDKFYCDGILDLFHTFIKDSSNYYKENLERKITIEELRRVIDIYLTSTKGEEFEDYYEKAIREVNFKVIKKNV